MDESSRKLFEKPLWSGQSVPPWVRFLAGVFLLLALAAGIIGALFITRDRP